MFIQKVFKWFKKTTMSNKFLKNRNTFIVIVYMSLGVRSMGINNFQDYGDLDIIFF